MTPESQPEEMVVRAPAVSADPADSSARQSQELSESFKENAINQELRRLNRALRALSACNQALARAGSEQEFLDQICDLIVRLGEYRMTWIGYALPDETKTVRPMALAGDDKGYLRGADVRWSETPQGKGAVGTAIRENRVCAIADTSNDPRFEPWRRWAPRARNRRSVRPKTRASRLICC
jgi:GAF domain